MKNIDASNSNPLRRRAEEMLDQNIKVLDSLNPDDMLSVIQELRVHQIELELQNDELRRTQEQLVKSTRKYSRLYDNAPVGYISLNEDGIILQANRTFSKMVGMDKARLTHRPFANLISPEQRQEYWARFRAFFKQPEGKNLEVKIDKDDGGSMFVQLEGRLEDASETGSAENDSPILLTTVTDITERYLTRMEVENQAAFLDTLLSNIPNPVFYKDWNGCTRAAIRLSKN